MNFASLNINQSVQIETFKANNSSLSATTKFQDNRIQSDRFYNRTKVSSSPAFKSRISDLFRKDKGKQYWELMEEVYDKIGKYGVCTLSNGTDIGLSHAGGRYTIDFTVPIEVAKEMNLLRLTADEIKAKGSDIVAIGGKIQTDIDKLGEKGTIKHTEATFIRKTPDNQIIINESDKFENVDKKYYEEALTEFFTKIVEEIG